jgi:hypothetical protein
VLPPKEEPHELLSGHRLDLPAEPGLGVVVDPSQQAPGAELLGAVGRRVVAAEGEAFTLQPGGGDGDIALGQTRGLRQVRNGRGPPVFQVAPEHLRRRSVAVERDGGDGRMVIRLDRRLREQELQSGTALHRGPQLGLRTHPDAHRSPLL